MASGILGSVYIDGTTNAVNTDVTVYTVPASMLTSCNVNVCNQTGSAVNVYLAVTNGASPASADWIEYKTSVPAYGVLERTGLVLQAGAKVFIRSEQTGVSCVVTGIEESA